MGPKPLEANHLFRLINHHQATGHPPGRSQFGGPGFGFAFAPQSQGQGLTALIHQAKHQGNHHRKLLGLARGGRGVLTNREGEVAALPIPVLLDAELRCPCLDVPAPELLQVDPGEGSARARRCSGCGGG